MAESYHLNAVVQLGRYFVYVFAKELGVALDGKVFSRNQSDGRLFRMLLGGGYRSGKNIRVGYNPRISQGGQKLYRFPHRLSYLSEPPYGGCAVISYCGAIYCHIPFFCTAHLFRRNEGPRNFCRPSLRINLRWGTWVTWFPTLII